MALRWGECEALLNLHLHILGRGDQVCDEPGPVGGLAQQDLAFTSGGMKISHQGAQPAKVGMCFLA